MASTRLAAPHQRPWPGMLDDMDLHSSKVGLRDPLPHFLLPSGSKNVKVPNLWLLKVLVVVVVVVAVAVVVVVVV